MPSFIPLGCFGSLSNLDCVAAAGYDQIELQNSEIISMDEERFLQAQAQLAASPVSCLVVNNPLPLELRIAEREFHADFYREHLQKGACRAAALGARFWNFGNGFARTLPAGQAQAKEKLMRVFDLVAAAAQTYGLTVLLEPLAKSITNQWNTLDETIAFIENSPHKNLAAIADMRWQLEEKQNFNDLYRYAGKIVHAHIDYPGTDYAHKKIRVVPRLDDGYDYSEFLSFIRSGSYHGALSVEALTFQDYYQDICSAMELFHAHGLYSIRQKEGFQSSL